MRALLTMLALFPCISAVQAETALQAEGIRQLLTDRSLYGAQNGAAVEQIFQKNGQTFYLVGGASSLGFWEVRGDQYCSQWPPNPSWACYDMTEDGDNVTFISKDGERTIMRKTP